MKSFIEKINETFKENKFYYCLVIGLFCIGIVIGGYTVKYMSAGDKKDLSGYFTTFVTGVGDRTIDYGSLFIQVLEKILILVVPMIIMSFTFFGGPFILIIDFLKGFTLGYTFSFLVTTYEGKGTLLALSSIMPQNLIYIPCIIGLSVISLKASSLRFSYRFSKKNALKKSAEHKGLYNDLIFIAIILMLGIIVETYVTPSLIKMVVSKFYT